MTIIYAIIFGFIFGFVLQKIGAASPKKIVQMLRLKDLHLMKSILLGIAVSSISLFVLLSIGIIDTAHVSVKGAYVGVLVGGLILGAGWAIAGYCPGTGVVAAGTGRKDAIFFIVGGLLGAFAFTQVYASLKTTFLFDDLGGKATLAMTGNDKFAAMVPSVPAIVIAGAIAVFFMIVAWKLPEKTS